MKITFLPLKVNGFLPRGRSINNIVTNSTNWQDKFALAVYIKDKSISLLDIDDSSSLPDKIKKLLIKNLDNLCICYHDTEERDGAYVITNMRFKLIFLTTDIEWNRL